ncbi:ATP-dependent DNA ligase [Tilletiaria anomala UBC 951]|uniref:ATP-dependent DNA ligase n=1 Tax=Tilletiaria anomala (strain ATCC 24038 / CBS 436.72 / UBC 951) TaxID=1037660 RepID=A0A066VIC3_TILAU|nr:ATP-dependent DNA ligase [Tilletiaria anomala UBC 951]KDN41251.1 ATP-dependent DNA ligase [Tilletiaria anomala UBC 951]
MPSGPSLPPKIDLAALDSAIESIPLHEDIFKFDPVSQVDTSPWPRAPAGDGSGSLVPSTPYSLMARAFTLISSTRSRLAITTLLTNLLRVIRAHDASSLLPAVYLVSNHIAPAYDGVELGLGGSILNKAILDVTGVSRARMKQLWNSTGDSGDVAFEARKGCKTLVQHVPLTVSKLYKTLQLIAGIKGQGSANAKLAHVTKLLVASRGEEIRFLVRTFVSHLRIQAVKTTIATALAMTFSLVDGTATESVEFSKSHYLITREDRKGLLATPTKQSERHSPARLTLMARLRLSERLMRQVRARHPNFSVIVPALQEVGLDGLSTRVPLSVGTPLSPMLGSITRSLQDMRAKFGERAFVSEFKYDGQRVQIHALFLPYAVSGKDGAAPDWAKRRREAVPAEKGRWVKCCNGDGEVWVRLFSRHLEDMTVKYPDICDLMPLLMGHGEATADASFLGALPTARPSEGDAATTASTSLLENPAASAAPPVKTRSLIMDAEVVAIGLQGEPLPFQTLANRSRKEVNIKDVKVKVGVFAFDLMYLDGKPLLKTSFRQRRKALQTRFPQFNPPDPLIARFAHVRSCESTDLDEISAFFEAAQASKCEGIMAKSLDHHWEAVEGSEVRCTTRAFHTGNMKAATGETEDGKAGEHLLEKLDDEVADELVLNTEEGEEDEEREQDAIGKGVNGRGKALLSTYEPDRRCESWLKVKRDYVEGMGDSLDLVPIGAWHGMGRKAAWWSPILLALYDPDTGGYQAVCKCISGFTDNEYKRIFAKFAEGSELCYDPRKREPMDEYELGGMSLPDVLFRPCEVWEVRGADITLSPVYHAALGLVSEERGLSMRFPRFIRRREDKSVENASTPEDLAVIYRAQ